MNMKFFQGTSGLGEQMDRIMQLTEYQVEKMKEQKDRFYLLDEDPQCVNVCFWYIPERLRKMEHTKQKEIELGVVSLLPYIRFQICFPYSSQRKFEDYPDYSLHINYLTLCFIAFYL